MFGHTLNLLNKMPSVKDKSRGFWKEFGTLSMQVKNRNFSNVYYYSWLEPDVKFHDADVFDTLSHVTMIENTEKILQEGLKLQKVDDYSCVNKCNDDRGFHHPLQNVLFLWVGADKLQNFYVTRYGNVRFSMKNLEFLQDMRFYYVEFLDYVSKSAVRIMVTKRNYDDVFRRFDPFDEEQEGKVPCLYKNGEWIKYLALSNSRKKNILLDVEFVLDSFPSQDLLYCTFVNCTDPRKMITPDGRSLGSISVYNNETDILRLITLLVRYQGFHQFVYPRLEQIGLLISIVQNISCQDSCLDDRETNTLPSSENLDVWKADRVLSGIEFCVAFDVSRVNEQDHFSIHMLDVLFNESDSLSNGHCMLNAICKGIKYMTAERSLKDVFETFFQYFLSKQAKFKVKRVLVNLFSSI